MVFWRGYELGWGFRVETWSWNGGGALNKKQDSFSCSPWAGPFVFYKSIIQSANLQNQAWDSYQLGAFAVCLLSSDPPWMGAAIEKLTSQITCKPKANQT